MKHRHRHFNPWRSDHIKTGTVTYKDDTYQSGYVTMHEAYNDRAGGCLTQSLVDIKSVKRMLMCFIKGINIASRLKQNYDRGRVPFITNRQLLKYQGFSGRPKKVLQKMGTPRGS